MRVGEAPPPPVEPAPVRRQLHAVDLCPELVAELERKNETTRRLDKRCTKVCTQKIVIPVIKSSQIDKKTLRRLHPIAELISQSCFRLEILVAENTRKNGKGWERRGRDGYVTVDSRRCPNGARNRRPQRVVLGGIP